MPTIQLETLIAAPIERCFDLARDIDAHTRSAAHTGERAVAGITHGLIEQGQTVTWEATHLGVRQRLTVRISRCEPPHLLVDEMVSGAFASFIHTHSFVRQEDGTRMMDRFEYVAPLGWLGRLADWLFLERYMRTFLLRRNAYLKQQAEAAPTP